MSTEQTRHLVLDSRIIDEAVNAKLTVGEVSKHPSNPLFAEDKPWEPRYDNVYANVIYDEDDEIYKCWYNPFIIDERVTSTPPEKRNPESSRLLGNQARPSGDGALLRGLNRRHPVGQTRYRAGRV